MEKSLKQRIKEGLDMIKINNDTTWVVPNRKTMNMSILEFVEFERARLLETNENNPKYWNHYHNKNALIKKREPEQLSLWTEEEINKICDNALN